MFSHLDNLRGSQLLYLSSMGIAATKEDGTVRGADATDVEEAVEGGLSDDEDEHPEDG